MKVPKANPKAENILPHVKLGVWFDILYWAGATLLLAYFILKNL